MGTVVSGLYDSRVSVLAKKMGLHFLAASEGYQLTRNPNQVDNSYYISSLLHAYKSGLKADTNNDGVVSVVELAAFAKKRSGEVISEKYQVPLNRHFGNDFPMFRVR